MATENKSSLAFQNPFAAASLGALDVPNPFAAAVSPFAKAVETAVDPDAPPAAYTYTLLRSGPDVEAEEVEVAHLASIEVRTVWGSNVLHVEHLTPPRSYFVGEEVGDLKAPCDFFLPSEVLGTTRAPVVLVNGGAPTLLILPRSHGTLEIPGQGKVSLAELVASGRARPSSELAGAHEIELPAGAEARMELEHSGLVFEVNAVNAGKTLPGGFFAQLDVSAYVYFALSVVLHVGIVASLAFFMPRMAGDDAEAIDRDAMLMMQHLLNASAEREEEKKETADNTDTQSQGGTGDQAKGPSGSMGTPTSSEVGKKYAVKGPPDNPDRHLAREEEKRAAERFGLIGIINTGLGGDAQAPTSQWGRDDSLGADAFSARGLMWGDALGESGGAGGLGLSGTGEGGGSSGVGIGLGRIGTIGDGDGGGNCGGGDCFGHGHGLRGGHHATTVPTMNPGVTTVNGRIPREVIQRIVRQNFGRFRLCYENGLRSDPNLTGRVVVKFAIDRTGGVMLSQDGGSQIRDQAVVACVVRSFGGLSFPPPDNGIVTVEYPIMFAPGE